MAKKAGVKLSDEPHHDFCYYRWDDGLHEGKHGAAHDEAWDVLHNIIETTVKSSIEILFEEAAIFPNFITPTKINLFLEGIEGFCEFDLLDVVDDLIDSEEINFPNGPEIGHAQLMAEISTGLKALAQKLDDAVEQAEKE